MMRNRSQIMATIFTAALAASAMSAASLTDVQAADWGSDVNTSVQTPGSGSNINAAPNETDPMESPDQHGVRSDNHGGSRAFPSQSFDAPSRPDQGRVQSRERKGDYLGQAAGERLD